MIEPATVACPCRDGCKTVVIVGACRGGTSMVTQIVRSLGVFVGHDFGSGGSYSNWEDSDFHVPLWENFESLGRWLLDGRPLPHASEFADRMQDVDELIRRRDTTYSMWGLKHAAALTAWCLQTGLLGRLRNPHIISVWRDPLAVWQHENTVQKWGRTVAQHCNEALDPKCSIEFVARQYDCLRSLMQTMRLPHLMVSYERSIRCPESLIEQLAEFLQLDPSVTQRMAAIDSVSQSSRI